MNGANDTPLPRPGQGYSFYFAGEYFSAINEAQLVVRLLHLFQWCDPDFLPRLQVRLKNWMRSRKVSRPFLAESREELYPTSPHLARYAVHVVNGWWIDSNNDTLRKRHIVRLACEVAGIREDELHVNFGWSR